MSTSPSEPAGRWVHYALNAALLALGVVVMALAYALVSEHVGAGRSPAAGDGAAAPPSTREAGLEDNAGDAGVLDGEIIQVGVRNGCGVEGLAAETRDLLVRAGFDVVDVGNHSTFDLDSSMVIDRVGNLAAARRVARAMDLSVRRVRQEIGEAYHLDATVVLGRDFCGRERFQKDDAGRTFAY